ncbi:hornerin-like [Plodia interpunctella]|uniref:hornerin-like n=1 Tax=Plodia interpunctella TaxID=58824 RepID=UPI0023678DA1|nr:hornerin-like [Plodia interpunctella]
MMARLGVVLAVVACASCMEMRETVERMVMVRTTGSDLQPAATGYIYKKEDDGPESVIKMEEDDVLEHLSQYYKQPEAFAAPIPVAAGPFYAKEDGDRAASHSKEYVIPVVEKTEESDDHVDGIADNDYDKIFKGYGFGKYNEDFADYLRDLGYFKDGLYHETGDGKEHGSEGHHDHGDKGYKGYASKHHYDKGGAGDYHTEKYESFSVSRQSGHKKDYDGADASGKHFEKGSGYKGGDHGHKSSHSKGEAVDGFHNIYNKDEFKKDHDFYDGEKNEGGFHKHSDGHLHHGSDAGGFHKGGSHESGSNEGGFGKGGFVEKESGDEHGAKHSKEEGDESSGHHYGEFAARGGQFGGKGYGYEVKH